MEKFTNGSPNLCQGLCKGNENYCSEDCELSKALDTLAEYEKTNKTPEQVEKLIEKNKILAKENRKLKKEMIRMMNYSWYHMEDEDEQE